MAVTSKSPKHVLTVALEAATRALPEHPHRFAPKVFTEWQLFACLVLKVHQQQDYRGVQQLLSDCPDLAAVIGLKRVPHFTTLQQAAERLLKSDDVQQLLESVLTGVRPGRRVTHAAADSTGFDTHHVSRYFVWRTHHRKDSAWCQNASVTSVTAS